MTEKSAHLYPLLVCHLDDVDVTVGIVMVDVFVNFAATVKVEIAAVKTVTADAIVGAASVDDVGWAVTVDAMTEVVTGAVDAYVESEKVYANLGIVVAIGPGTATADDAAEMVAADVLGEIVAADVTEETVIADEAETADVIDVITDEKTADVKNETDVMTVAYFHSAFVSIGH